MRRLPSPFGGLFPVGEIYVTGAAARAVLAFVIIQGEEALVDVFRQFGLDFVPAEGMPDNLRRLAFPVAFRVWLVRVTSIAENRLDNSLAL